MQFLDLAGVKKFKQYVDENFTPVEDHENAEKVAAAALNNLNDRLTNIEDEDWVTAEDYSEIESAHLDVYSKEEIDSMLSNIEGGTGEENVIESITFNGSVVPINNSTKTAAIMAKIPHAETDSSSTATAFTATVPGITTLEDGVCCYIKNTVIASAAGCTLNVNNLGAKRIYVTTAATTAATTQFALNYTVLFIYNATRVSGGCWDICQLFNSNTTYSVISTAELQTGTATSSRVITAARLAENYNITNGTINIAGNSITPITSETDPTVPAWAKASTKPTYTASEVGALPDTTSIPTESTVSNWGFTKNSGTITGITMNGTSKGTSGVVNLGTVLTEHQDISGKASLSGAAFTGTVTGTSSGNASQFRNITISSSEPTASQGSNGDIWIVI